MTQAVSRGEGHTARLFTRPRVFVRGVESLEYNLNEQRRRRLASVPRVIPARIGESEDYQGAIIQPGNEPFLTQSLHISFSIVPPLGQNEGHGHQNEALFYILEGRGYELHDGERYDWEAGDAVAVHNDSVHWHNNADPERRSVALIVKAKPLWLFLGLWQQGEIGHKPADDERWGPPMDWTVARVPEDLALKKVIKPADTPWEETPHGRIRWLAAAHVPLRIKATDAFLLALPPSGRSGRRWQMADEICYVLEGSGYDLHWEVALEISDRYLARVALEPTRWEWKAGDLIWVPQNSVFQHFNTDPATPARLLSVSNRVYKQLGYRVVDLEP